MRSWWTGSPAVSPRGIGRPPRDKGDAEAGFTLVEVLVAFAIAVILLGAVLELFSTALHAGSDASSLARATLIAQSSLDGARATDPLAESDRSDQVDGVFER